MKVSELIEELQKLDPDKPVYVLESSGDCGCRCGEPEYDELQSVEEDVSTRRVWEGEGHNMKYGFKHTDIVRLSVY